MDRRKFLKTGGRFLAATPFACDLLVASVASASGPGAGRWGMVIDLRRCPEGCDACVKACRRENNVAEHGDPRWDVHWIRQVEIRPHGQEDAPTRTVPLLCNHCERPPCAQVCPVRATYQRDDGIVIVDHHRCIGCRYCLIACPYNARFFNYRENEAWPNKDYPKRSHGVAESCHLCAHRLDQGRLPACMEACRDAGAGAIVVGDLDNPESEISRLIAANSVKRIREDLGTGPKVHYIGL
ncbi:MAG: 4Fe-4S dicluster domain-containing protein [bacterium]|nr:4Fe-4S dicluster domain-containing protein [bacterium]